MAEQYLQVRGWLGKGVIGAKTRHISYKVGGGGEWQLEPVTRSHFQVALALGWSLWRPWEWMGVTV